MRLGTFSTYFSKALHNGDTFKADGFLSRSLFDLYSNFTFYLNDPINGDAFQQHDSRLQQGLNGSICIPSTSDHLQACWWVVRTSTITRSTWGSIRVMAGHPQV